MKTQIVRNASLGLILTSLLMAPALLAQTPVVAKPSPATEQADIKPSTNVSGKVEARSDSSLTVAGHTISLKSSTTYSRAGASISGTDIKVGDMVNIVTSNDGQVAVSVSCTE